MSSTRKQCEVVTPLTDTIIHPDYGDLRLLDSVCINQIGELVFPKESNLLYIHLTVTTKCTARCKGCINGCVTFDEFDSQDNSEAVPQRDAAAILNLIEKDNAKDVAVCFYGGEPLLSPDIIKETIDIILSKKPEDSIVRFMVYTNGMPIKKVLACDSIFVDKIWLYSISIDGSKNQHDAIRLGTSFKQIEENLEYLKQQGGLSEKLMWTTLREEQSLRDAFDTFISLNDRKLVDHFFWHFVEIDEPFQDLKQFGVCYENDLRYILETYIYQLKHHKRLLSFLHINELILYLLCGKHRNSTACGVELQRNYDIVSGNIQTCADLPPAYTIGTINSDGSLDIKDQNLSHLVTYKDALGCHECGIHAYCGGRCPVQGLTCNATRVKQYCQLMRLHVATVNDYLPEIKNALEKAALSLQDVYDQSAYYVQFTDVTP